MIKCAYPWMHLNVTISGNITPCCISFSGDDPQWWHNVKLSDGLYSSEHIKMRNDMRNDIWPKICKICEDTEKEGVISHREASTKHLDLDIDYNKEPNKLEFLGITFNNICNLGCRMCNPDSSSLLSDEYKKHNEYPIFLTDYNKKEITTTFKEDEKIKLTKDAIVNGLQILKVTGGEPFASSHFMDLINWCIDKGYAKNLSLRITTNGIKFNSVLLNKLLKFKKTRFTISIDGVNKLFNYIRWPGKWDQVEVSIDMLMNYINKHPDKFTQVQLNVVLQSYNVLQLADIYNWCTNKGLKFNVDTNFKPRDAEFNVLYLPDSVIDEAINRIKDIDNDKIRAVIKILCMSNINYKKLNDLLTSTKILDKHRGQDYRNYLDSKMVAVLEMLDI